MEHTPADEGLGRAYYEALVSSSDDAILGQDTQQRITSWNDGAARLYGYSASEAIGEHISLILPPGREAEELQRIHGVGRGGARERFETHRRHKDGHLVPVLLTLSPLWQEGELRGVVSIGHDISECLGASAAREAQEVRTRSILDTANDSFLAMDAEGRITEWNRAAEHTLGWRREEVLGQSLGETIIPERYREAHQTGLVRVLAGGAPHVLNQRIEIEALRKDGHEIPIELSVWRVDTPGPHGSVVSFNAFLHDVTERKVAEAALAEARDQALEGLRAKSEFLATMSHEIRTPMNGVIGLTGLLLATELDPTQRRYASGVQGAGEALLSIIDDILDFSRIEAGKVELEESAFDPRQLVEDIGMLLGQQAAAKSLELVAYCEPGVPARIRGDAGRLRQILLNLASNALKFTAQGEVVISMRMLGRRPDAGQGELAVVSLSVSDTGIGIDPETQVRLFEPFTQADASTTRRFGGTGLGLAISQRLVEAMGGQIQIESSEGAGSTFSFEIALPVDRRSTSRTVEADVLAEVSVLVVDDNHTNQEVLSGQLSAWGMRPRAASSGVEALDLLHEAAQVGAPYPLVILDLMMPEMDGLELASRINEDASLGAPQMVILTSAGELDSDAALRAGVSQWAEKPVRSSELYEAITRVLRSDSAAREHPGAQPQSVDSSLRGRVLVVEDNQVNQLVAEAVLEQLGFRVTVVDNGAQALEQIAGHEFDIVLMDCHMPVMDGFEATRVIRASEAEHGGHIPVIAMTAGVLPEDRAACTEAGMDGFVSKPIDVEALEATLAGYLPTPPSRTDLGRHS